MYSLILKDILVQKKMLYISFIYIFFMIITFQSNSTSMLPAAIGAVTYIMVITACAYDDRNKTELMLNSLPLKRSKIVLERYLSIFFFGAIGFVEYILISLILGLINIPLKVSPITLEGFLGAMFGITILGSIYFPVYFKLGYIKSKVVNFILFFLVFFGFGTSAYLIKKNSSSEFFRKISIFLNSLTDLQAAIIFIGLMIIILLISFGTSLKIYSKREF